MSDPRPIAFKVRTQGRCDGSKGGKLRDGTPGGVGALWYHEKVFTIACHADQWLLAGKGTGGYRYPSPTPMHNPIRYLSVCSGMEAATVAWHPLGFVPIGFSEIAEFPSAILKHRFPSTPNYGSLIDYQSWPLEPGSIDLLVGGTPCQSFSVAGLRKGLDDQRGNLALVFLGLADKLKPRWIVWENVPGVLSSSGGRDFGSFIGAMEDIGYQFAWRVLNAEHFGVAQRRRRLFLVGYLGDWRPAAAVLFEPESLRGDPSPGKRAREKSPAGADVGFTEGRGSWWDGGQVSQTLDAVLSKGQTMPEKNRFPAVLQPSGFSSSMAVRKITPLEGERLQGFPDNWSRISWKGKPEEDCPDGPRLKAIGNSMAVPVMRWIGSRISAVDSILSSHAQP